MKPTPLWLVATPLLTMAITLISLRTEPVTVTKGETETRLKQMPKPGISKHDRQSPVDPVEAGRTGLPTAMDTPKGTGNAPTARTQGQRLTPKEAQEPVRTATYPNSADLSPYMKPQAGPKEDTVTVRAVRLAENFRLPVAVMANAGPEAAASHPAPILVKQATQSIADDFYRNLLIAASDEKSSAVAKIETSEDGDATAVIEPNPETDRIRKQSDELYRTLFGDEAFVRYSMRSALEFMLPPPAYPAPRGD